VTGESRGVSGGLVAFRRTRCRTGPRTRPEGSAEGTSPLAVSSGILAARNPGVTPVGRCRSGGGARGPSEARWPKPGGRQRTEGTGSRPVAESGRSMRGPSSLCGGAASGDVLDRACSAVGDGLVPCPGGLAPPLTRPSMSSCPQRMPPGRLTNHFDLRSLRQRPVASSDLRSRLELGSGRAGIGARQGNPASGQRRPKRISLGPTAGRLALHVQVVGCCDR
jgi:hypothetical protein